MSTVVMGAVDLRRTLGRMAHEILEATGGSENVAVVGILGGGYPVAKRLAFLMTQIEGATVPCGSLDVSSARDDRRVPGSDSSEIPFQVEGRTVVLVDEVIFTGRTVRAAMDSLFKFGRPRSVKLAVLIDRGHRELPIQPDFVGKLIETTRTDHVAVVLPEDGGEDSVTLSQAEMAEARRP
ncbi:MAG: bifunctional pyr operon transcriptional regulator/uracil phosphoribosyltransferase PyrR [Fimbriimonadaceae bacterium]|nr:bifunctional pyr operon transcriptional regulator/uracil phosphoribosyltransferase PyrR [Fimbriimonadaceae bacterium]QYK57383.1 MAG: bifunctional pyr operon transcriptional regulator/uracil phosphoribosyltransferase PyrR [Fimbriimonadaceae bacterium]